MARSSSSLGTTSYASTGTKSITLSATPSAGDVLTLVISATDPACTWSNITDNTGGTWTERASSPVSTGALRGIVFEKIANGSETSVSFDVSTSVGQAQISRITGWTGTATFEAVGENESNLSSASTSLGSGSASNSTAEGAAVAVWASDRWDTVETGRSYSASFTEIGAATTSGSRPGAWSAFKNLTSAAPQSCTFSCSDSGDEGWGAILVYGDVTGGGSISGDAAITEDDDTAAAAGTVDVAGAVALTEDADTAAATGTLAVAGAADLAEADDAVSAAGAVDVSGAASVTEADDTLASDGTVAAGGGVSGDAAITEADDAAAAAGTVAVAGAADISEAGDTVGATGAVGIVGDASVLEGGDTLSAAGTVAAPGGDIIGQAAIVEGDDALQASGTAQTPTPPAEDPFWLYRDQDRAINEDSFPHTGRSSDMLKLFRRFRRRA